MPCLQANGWIVAAVLTYLEVLNGSDVTLEQHILANRKHGDVDDQRRLALRIFDEAFVAAAVRAEGCPTLHTSSPPPMRARALYIPSVYVCVCTLHFLPSVHSSPPFMRVRPLHLP